MKFARLTICLPFVITGTLNFEPELIIRKRTINARDGFDGIGDITVSGK